MEESTTYQWIVEQGRVRGLAEGEVQTRRDILLVQGEDRFGAPSESVRAELQAINDEARLKAMAKRILHVASWKDLLATE